ncbi:MAG: basic rane protein [Ilumatobacteraceae bacterium]|jgi:basic membrane protein A
MRASKRFTSLAAVVALGLLAAACGSDAKSATTNAPASTPAAGATTPGTDATATTPGGTQPTSSSAATPGTSNLTAGVAFDTGGRGDGTFNDSAGRGLDQAVSELGVKKIELEATKDEDRKTNLELLVQQKANPIIGVGFLFGDPMLALATANPNTTFAIVDSVVDAPNVRSLVFAENEGSFLVGAAAALKSKTGHIGFIGGQEIDLIKKFEAGYIAGAKAVNPAIKVDSKYLGPAGDNSAWGNVAGAKEIAKGWYDAGADVIYTAAGGSGAGTIQAAVEANAWAIGVDSDQYLIAKPDEQKHILTSMLKHVDVAVFQTIKAVADGDTKGGIITFDLKSDGVGYATSGGFLDDIKSKLDAYKADIISGKIVVPTKP